MERYLPVLIMVAVVAAILLLKRLGQIAPAQVRALLQQGAVVIDVRSPGEFARGHLRGAVNIPASELAERIGRKVPDKSHPVLLHCLSGARSGMGARALRSLGYANVHNLGSLGRARRLVEN
jgi:phage shock protein E